MAPTKVGRYEVKSELGHGGMATVYQAQDPAFSRLVAIKIMRQALLHDPTFRSRFEREAKTVASLEHPAIVPVYDYGEHEGQPYLVMRFMAGGSLEDRLKQGPLSLTEVARLISRLAPALDLAHRQGIVHRDLKPGNILFDQNGDPYLTDFGIVKLTEASFALTGESMVLGTPAYMSPEQGKGDAAIDGRSDIYSLGAILFQMWSGKIPYDAPTPTAIIFKHITEPVPSIHAIRPDLPATCQSVINRALAKRREDRYATAQELAEAVIDVVRGKERPAQAGIATEYVSPMTIGAESAVPVRPEATVYSPAPPPGGSTQLEVTGLQGVGKARVGDQPRKRRFPLVWVLTCGGLAVLALVGLVVGGGYYIVNSNAHRSGTRTAQALAAMPTATPRPTETLQPPTLSLTPAITNTPLPTATIAFTPTISPTPLAPQIVDSQGVPMGLIPAGSFQMGSQGYDSDESPIHTVKLSAFYMDVYEVTTARYAACVSARVCSLPTNYGSNTHNFYYKEEAYANYPMINVTWLNAQEYCEWRGARLPTETEWEKAARGGLDGKLYPWGDEKPVCTLGTVGGANFDACGSDTMAVGSFQPNGYGLYDMAGNVWEWTSSLYQPYPYQPNDGREDPNASGQRVMRGSGWYPQSSVLRVSNRSRSEPASGVNYLGFRCVSSP